MSKDGQRLHDICCHNLDNYFVDMCYINQFKPNWISHSYQFDQSIFVLRIVGIYIFYFKEIDRTFCKQMVEP